MNAKRFRGTLGSYCAHYFHFVVLQTCVLIMNEMMEVCQCIVITLRYEVTSGCSAGRSGNSRSLGLIQIRRIGFHVVDEFSLHLRVF
jgi:hypothetical protein